MKMGAKTQRNVWVNSVRLSRVRLKTHVSVSVWELELEVDCLFGWMDGWMGRATTE